MIRFLTTLCLLTLGLSGCGPQSENSSVLQDIFTQDTGQRRHKATKEEMLWTIDMGGCTGHLLNTQYMMTANHCSPSTGATYRSGSALAKASVKDITVASKAECNSSLDYCILKITWKNGSAPADQNFPPKVATAASQIVASTQADQGDFVFTVGFPGDQTSATYSEGQLKRVSGTKLVYNMGIINGNSGGGVWRKSDRMLVSLTNSGPNALGDAGWDNNDVNDSSHWNSGAAMWDVYSSSSLLKTLFPNGDNAETSGGGTTPPPGDGGTPPPGGGTTPPGGGGTTPPDDGTPTPPGGGGTTPPGNGGGSSPGGSPSTNSAEDIFIGFPKWSKGSVSSFVWMATNRSIKSVALCRGEKAACTDVNAQVVNAQFSWVDFPFSNRKFFRSKTKMSMQQLNGTYTLLGMDASGTTVVSRQITLSVKASP